MSNISQLPPNVQERIQRLQQLQNTLQQLLLQKQRVEIEMNESSRALETLENVDAEAKVFKSVGAVLVERPKEDIVKDLTERMDFLEMRVKVIDKQEVKAKERLDTLQATLQKELGIAG